MEADRLYFEKTTLEIQNEQRIETIFAPDARVLEAAAGTGLKRF
jgi:hypothetical protein